MASELLSSVPAGQKPLSIEAYKLAMQYFEQSLTKRLTTEHPSDHLHSLCTRCAVVALRLQSVIDNFKDDPNPGNAASRNSTTNIFLGTLPEILAQEKCVLCCLIAKAFVRAKRSEIYEKIVSSGLEFDIGSFSMQKIACLVYPVEEEGDRSKEGIHEILPSSIQISLDTVAVDGTLSLWWPETVADEVNDEPIQLPMVAEDHCALFGAPNPWVFLPSVVGHSQRDLGMYHKCFKACLQQHQKCRQTRSTYQPSRLIDIQEMKIVGTSLEYQMEYFALSYVWGQSPFLNLQFSKRGLLSQPGSLLSQALPRSIADAIDITRLFGRRYLWVDALCIVQDDHVDKMQEINSMHHIYAGAKLTVVAATGNEANVGLLSIDPSFLSLEPHFLAGYRFGLDRREMRDVVEFSTWFTRGWTFQELIFSQRLLYFTPERTYFSCAVGNCSEDCPFDENVAREVYEEFRDDDPKAGFDFLHHPEEQGGLDDDDFDDNNNDVRDPFDNYSLMVEKITTRAFTQETDILNACQGFYRGILLKDLGASVCGLPASCFEFALAWHPSGNLRQRTGPGSQFAFPSWSWAAWVGPITYPFLSSPQRLEIRRCIEWSICAQRLWRGFRNDDEKFLNSVLPSLEGAEGLQKNYTKWKDYATQSRQAREWQTGPRRFPLLLVESEEIMPLSFIEYGLLIFKTETVQCAIHETDTPDLAE